MAVRKIYTSKDFPELLSADSARITVFDDETDKLIDDLLETMHAHSICVGLAAPQIGVSKAAAVANLKNDEMDDLVLVNPKIVREFGKKDTKLESCMSVPDVRGPVEMRKSIEVEYQDREGVHHTATFSGFLARVVRHEIDHLYGTLYTDYISSDEGLEEVDIFRKSGFGPEHLAEPK